MSKETQKWLNLLSNNPLCRYNKLVKCQCDHVTSLNVFDKLLILLVFPPSLKENIALFRNGIILFYSSVFKKLTTWRVFTKLWGRHLGIWYMSPKFRYDMLALLGLGFLPTWKDWGGGAKCPLLTWLFQVRRQWNLVRIYCGQTEIFTNWQKFFMTSSLCWFLWHHQNAAAKKVEGFRGVWLNISIPEFANSSLDRSPVRYQWSGIIKLLQFTIVRFFQASLGEALFQKACH